MRKLSRGAAVVLTIVHENLERSGLALLILAVLLTPSSAWAKKLTPEVDAVFVVFGPPDTVMILGADFDCDSDADSDSDSDTPPAPLPPSSIPPDVTLAGSPLTIISATREEVVAELPAGLPDGDYQLEVACDQKKRKSEYDLTIGAVGPQGPQGEQGDVGPPGPPGISGYERVSEIVTLGAEGFPGFDYSLNCPAGKKIFGGGQSTPDGIKRLDVWRNGPTSDGSWLFTYTVLPGGEGREVVFSVICADVAP